MNIFRFNQSIGAKLFIYVLAGILFGLGGMAYFFYQEFKTNAENTIISSLKTQVQYIDGQLKRVEESLIGLSSATKSLHSIGISDPKAYKALAFEFFQKRPPLVVGNGFGQTPSKIVPSTEWYWPYFYVDQNQPDAVGKQLPAPYDNIRFAELFADDNYPKQDYYTKPFAEQKPMWSKSYDWYGITMTSFLNPFYDNKDKMIGIAGADINVTALTKKVSNSVIKEGGYFAILDQQGDFLSYPPDPEKARARSSYKNIPLFKQTWAQIQQKQTGMLEVDGTFFSYQRIPSTQWIMFAVVPDSLILGPVLTITAMGTLGAIIILALVIILFIRSLNSRLNPILFECNQLAKEHEGAIVETIDLTDVDELEVLDRSFKYMTTQLKTSFETLDAKVIDRTAQLNDKIEELTKTREELIQSEKMAALGQLVAGIAHEVNTPLGAIRSSAETLSSNLKQTLEQFPKLFQVLTPEQQDKFFALLEESLQSKITLTVKEKRVAKKAITADLKKCEIENARILTDTFISLGIYEQVEQYLELLKHPDNDFIFDIAYKLSTLTRSTGNILKAVDRASKVIFALKTYAHYDHSGEKSLSNLQEGLETVLTLYHNQMKHGIELATEYEDIPAIQCYPDELNQVWTNLVHNALQAMDHKGSIKLAISQRDNYAIVSISDSGKGIPDDIKDKIFTPFFTTKPAGEGSGLGLDIVKKIIDKHDGKIELESELGKGTTFSIFLPMSDK